MPKNIRIQRKIAFPIFLCLTFLLCIFAIVNIQTIRKITRQKIETEALRLASLKAQEIESFFKERAMIPQIVFKDPFLIRWFSQYRNFRAPVKSDPNYQRIISFFLSMVESDSTIKSVYFATDNTQEYFDQEGRFEEDGYFVKNRSWWNRALEMGKLYCELDDYDYEDSTLSASLQMPVYLHNGRLLGVGGVDILISTVGNIISQIQYKNQGFAFLVDEEGEVVYFPGLELEIGLGKKLTLLDSIYRDTYGFQSLETDIVNRREGMRDIHLKGEDYRVIFTSVHANEPLLDWNLGILVPVSIITSPVHRITNISIFMILFVILAIFALTWTITSSTVKPLNALASRLNEMANQKSNLTYQLPVETKDAIGLTAKNFNQFISQIRNLLIHVIKNTGNVVAWIEKMQQHTSEISNESGEMSIQSKEAADTSKIMLNNVKIMFKGLSQVSELLKKTNQSINKNSAQIEERLQKLREMLDQIEKLSKTMGRFIQKTNQISNAVATIEDINERTSLLSINASIEAVKAGDAGSGFSVVAQEIKELSEQTSLTNQSASHLLNEFKKEMTFYRKQLSSVRSQVSGEFKALDQIAQTFQTLHLDVDSTDIAAGEMKDQTEQQMKAIHQFDEHIQQISEATRNIANRITVSFREIERMNKVVDELRQSTDAFIVE